MSNAYIPSRRAPLQPSVLPFEAPVAAQLPQLRVHARVLRDLRRAPPAPAILLALHAPPALLIEDVVPPAHFPHAYVPVPVVPCDASNLRAPARRATGGRRGDTSLLSIFGAVARWCWEADGSVSLAVVVDVPRFWLWRGAAIFGANAPVCAEVSLTIVLSGGEPVRDGENVGFLVRGVGPLVVEPVHMDEDVRRRVIVGMWALGGDDAVWLAAAAFVAEAVSKRNIRLGKRASRRTAGEEMEQSFLMLQFPARRGGGDGVFTNCRVRTEGGRAARETFCAVVVHGASDLAARQGEILSAEFISEDARLAEERAKAHAHAHEVLQAHARDANDGSVDVSPTANVRSKVQEITERVEAFSASFRAPNAGAALESRAGAAATAPGTRMAGGASREDRGELKSANEAYGDVPRIRDVVFGEFEDGRTEERHGGDGEWERMDLLAGKYLGASYAAALESARKGEARRARGL